MQPGNTRGPLVIAAIAAGAAYLCLGHSTPGDLWRLVPHLRVAIDGQAGHDVVTHDDADDDTADREDDSDDSATSERRHVGEFDGVILHSGAKATITVGDTPSVKLTAPPEILATVRTTVVDGKLTVIGNPDVRVAITVPHIKVFTIDGAGQVDLRGLREPIAITVNGSAGLTASGSVASLDLTMNGPGKLSLSKLEAKNVRIKLNGAGGADIFATDNLVADIRGNGNIRYLGAPHTETSIVGPGSVRPMTKGNQA